MFKAWRSDKNKTKAVFKLQFQASQVPKIGWDSLAISLIPLDIGKPTVKSEKIAVHGGACRWENPIYETIRFSRDPKTRKFSEKVYQIVVFSGSSKGGILGEVAIDFASYVDAIKPIFTALPLRSSNSGTVLHVTIQRLHDIDGREGDNREAQTRVHRRTLQSQLSSEDLEESSSFANELYEDSVSQSQGKKEFQMANSNGPHRELGGLGRISGSSQDSSSEQNTPKEGGKRSNSLHQDVASFLSSLSNNASTQHQTAHRRSNTEWSVSSGPDGTLDESGSSPDNYQMKERTEDSDILSEKLKKDVAVLSRQAEVSELEIQTLRKQIVKESRRGQDLCKEVNCLKEERDALKRECEQLRSSDQMTNKMPADSGNLHYAVESLSEDLNYEKDLNANLRLQLLKTQESNSELILAVQDLEEMLEHKSHDRSLSCATAEVQTLESQVDSTDFGSQGQEKEVKPALEEVAQFNDENKSEHSVELKILDLQNEIEIYKKDKEALVMQMEQLSLDYQILKQENHAMSSRLKQNELQEQLKIRNENAASLALIDELKLQIQCLENELKNQAVVYEDNLEEIAREKMEQEQKAIQAEEALRKMRLNNANAADRLQEEFRRLSAQMSSTFEVNEKLAMQAQGEANELRMQKSHLENLLEKTKEELELVKDQYAAKVEELSDKMTLKDNEIDRLVLELAENKHQVENWKVCVEAREKNLLEDIHSLNAKVQELNGEKNEIAELMIEKEELINDTVRRLESVKEEKEALLKEARMDKDALKELNQIKQIKDEREATFFTMQTEMDTLRSEYNNVKNHLFQNEQEIEKIRKQAIILKTEIHKKEEELTILKKKLKDGTAKVTISDGAAKTIKKNNKSSPPSRGSKDVSTLRDKIKLLEGEAKLKEDALEKSAHSFAEKETDLLKRIEQLEKEILELNEKHIMDACDTISSSINLNSTVPAAMLVDSEKTDNGDVTDESGDKKPRGSVPPADTEVNGACGDSGGQVEINEVSTEFALLKEQNKFMEVELKEMRERYSEISLKFAEVEGERQQLVMAIRNLKNTKKN